MPKSDWCRKNMDRVKEECYGGELTVETMRDAKKAIEFCKRAPCLKMQSTLSVNMVRTIKDPKIQGRVIEMIESALNNGIDPRTNEAFPRKNGAFCITTPLLKWMIKYAETGERPPYQKRGQRCNKNIDIGGFLSVFDEFMTSKTFDRSLKAYIVPQPIMLKLGKAHADLLYQVHH